MASPDSPAEVFRKKSRTFSLAAKLFAPADRDAVARLYLFCRQLDDLADDTMTGDTAQLERVLRELQADIEPVHPITVNFRQLAVERKLPLAAARTLAEALREDCGPGQVRSETELLQFAFGVAGTVGLLMCPVLSVDDERSRPFAVDLGIALQLTNIARDIVEDAERSRYYLPSEWVRPTIINEAILGRSGAIEQVDAALQRLLKLAERFYESAFAGHWFIPSRNRRAVFLATRLYRAIGLSLLQKGSGAWQQRRSLSGKEKTFETLKTIQHYREMKATKWASAEAPAHETSLARLHTDAGIELTEYVTA